MRQIVTKQSLISMVGLILARVVILELGMVGIGFFLAMMINKKNRLLSSLCIGIGFLTQFAMVDAIKYILIMAVISVIITLMEYNKVQVTIVKLAVIGSLVTMAITATSGLLAVTDFTYYLRILGEGIVIVAITIVLRISIEYIMEPQKQGIVNNQQKISLILFYGFLILGLPTFDIGSVTLALVFTYLSILGISYYYGAGYGAIIGVISGLVLMTQGKTVSDIALYCIVGVIVGLLQSFSKFLVGTSYVCGVVILAEFLGGDPIGIGEFIALIVAGIFFLLIPSNKRKLVSFERKRIEEEDVFVKQSMQTIAKSKLKDISESFHSLSNTFYHLSTRENPSHLKELSDVFTEVSEGLCSNCSNCSLCWEQNYQESLEGATTIVKLVQNNGLIGMDEVPQSFANRCIHINTYISETRRFVDIAKINLYWHNKMAENREIIATQLNEVANIINDFSHDLYQHIELSESKKRLMLQQFESCNIEVNNIAIFEKRNGKQELYLTCRMVKGTCLTSKEAALYISEIMSKKMRPDDSCKHVIGKSFETFIFVEDVSYKTLTGIAKVARNGEVISGDNYSILYPETDTMVMSLSDGMGSGEEAYVESEFVIELLEKFVEAGFKKESAIKLINSLFILKSGEQSFSTMDLSVVNLYNGNCDFIKIGASCTFIKKNEKVEILNSTSLPVGIVDRVEFDIVSRHLIEDSYIIMVTDGVIDSIEGEKKDLILAEFISRLASKNPTDIANSILEYSLSNRENEAIDDMTVLVAGFWRK